MLRYLSLPLLLFALSCTPNSSILQDKSGAEPGATPPAEATPPDSVRRFTVAELMDRIAAAPPDSFLFPCTLNAYSNGDRAGLKKLRDDWVKKEPKDRYLIAPSTGCICPSICVLAVQDARTPSSWGVVVIGEKPSSYYWAARDVDLSNASLTWTNAAPQIVFRDQNGAQLKSCTVEPAKGGGYAMNCVDPTGKTVSVSP